MKNYSAFDVIGPRMIGPSSSHTAGAARLGKVARRICGEEVKKVIFTLHGSFAKTYRGHGTDKALVAGILGMEPEDKHLRKSMEIAKKKGLDYQFVEEDLGDVHPNTVKISMIDKKGNQSEIVGSSIGGGNIKIIKINGLDVEFTGEYSTLIVRQIDVPGVIAKVTKIVSQVEINIAFMRVFRQNKGKDAFMIIETDDPIPKGIIEKIRSIGEEIIHVYIVDVL
ncbi:L-serine ammonia-lyase, iron-sulfur-dependent subunit beta [Crassaminicella indica]|uniref:L-serine deaminase n=1 Tax=Crassaminicella indica TaxID=2855394 RepID=A0ABX8RA61_9CLOT|nr:L-serine ammonia-lyase, iron-sulfur-dependent subunit beta [Crassaminicella indica]QXM05913.1 L-serine ammonia-lyase, iron-sulfur-dependent subunit beta [Crassaminicella indica]